jgi:Transposase DDE domain group 1
MADPAGESKSEALRLDFDRRLLLRFHGSTITSDAGPLAYRDLDDALNLTDTGAETLADARTGKNGRHRPAGLLRQSVFGRLDGYEDVNDAARLGRDPAMRWVIGDRAITGFAASASQMGRLETKWLSRPENLAAHADLPGQWIGSVHHRRPPKRIVLDMDSSESPTYGEQEGSAYNGHFGCTCCHPLFVFNQLGDVERCALRPGNVHNADRAGAGTGAGGRPLPGHREAAVFSWRCGLRQPRDLRVPRSRRHRLHDSAAGHNVLQDRIGYLLKRPVGRPPHEVRRYFASFGYQAKSWKKPRRVVAKVEWHPNELYMRVGFIVTNLARPAKRLVAFHNQRGTAEQWIKKGKGARSSGPVCYAAPSPPTPSASNCTRSPTTSSTSCGRSRCPRRRSRGR